MIGDGMYVNTRELERASLPFVVRDTVVGVLDVDSGDSQRTAVELIHAAVTRVAPN
jgi:hypothetical protein